MRASSPVTRCPRFSLVETCTVSRQRRSASAVNSVSGVAERKLPPIAKKTFAPPECIARIACTVSKPWSRGGSKQNSRARASRNSGFGRSQIPMVRSPCTLLWPRTGQAPAPGLPMLPFIRSRFTISWMFATALRCWVSPIAQVTMILSRVATSSATRRMSSLGIPLPASISSHPVWRSASANASNPAVRSRTKAWSSTSPGRRASASRSSFMIPLRSGTSPLILTGRWCAASCVPGPRRVPTARKGFMKSCGCLKRFSPASGSGLIDTIWQPLSTARSSAVSIRGWFVPGFCPITRMTSAWSKSSSVTVPFPIPMTSESPVPLDSWHMLEQSGRLLVPNCRTKSW